MHQFLKFIFGIKFYMFRTVPLSIISSFSLYTQQCYMSYSLRAGSGHVPSWSCSQAVSKPVCIAVCTVKNCWWWTEKLSETSSSSLVICQTTGPKPLPKRFLHTVRSRISSFNWQYPLLSLRSSSSFLRLLPRLLVTSICPFIFPSITCCRRQFLLKMWPIQLAFHFVISCRIFLCSLTLSNTSSFLTWSVQLIFSILLQHHISKLSTRFLKIYIYI